MCEPTKSGYTPYGTPESSLAVTHTSGSPESSNAQQSMACPAVPALPASRVRERSDSSRHSPGRSSSDTGSSVIRQEAKLRKLQAAVELARAKYKLARHEFEESSETSSSLSHPSGRSRSTRGGNLSHKDRMVSRHTHREEERTMLDMQQDSIDRFRQSAGTVGEPLATVIEDIRTQ